MKEASELAVQVASEDPEVGLRAVAALRLLLERLERIHVENARRSGHSWREIAPDLGGGEAGARARGAPAPHGLARSDARSADPAQREGAAAAVRPRRAGRHAGRAAQMLKRMFSTSPSSTG